jgi:hypothetical protein
MDITTHNSLECLWQCLTAEKIVLPAYDNTKMAQ